MWRGDAVMRAVRVREVRVAAAAIEQVAEVSVEIAAVTETEKARAVWAAAHDDFVAIIDGEIVLPIKAENRAVVRANADGDLGVRFD